MPLHLFVHLSVFVRPLIFLSWKMKLLDFHEEKNIEQTLERGLPSALKKYLILYLFFTYLTLERLVELGPRVNQRKETGLRRTGGK